jgi:hypothetical protein
VIDEPHHGVIECVQLIAQWRERAHAGHALVERLELCPARLGLGAQLVGAAIHGRPRVKYVGERAATFGDLCVAHVR